MVKLRGRAWAAKRGLLRNEARTPGKFLGGKAAAEVRAPMKSDVDPEKILLLLNFDSFSESTHPYIAAIRSIWLCSRVRKRVEIKGSISEAFPVALVFSPCQPR